MTASGDGESVPLGIIRKALEPRFLGRVPAGQPNEGAETWEQGGADDVYRALLEHRDSVFAPGNDKVWGEGEWIRCDRCPDTLGWPSYHSKALHIAGSETRP